MTRPGALIRVFLADQGPAGTLHQALLRRARAHKRSLSQQALFELEQVTGGDPRQRRIAALARIAEHWRGRPPVDWPVAPEDWIRADREC